MNVKGWPAYEARGRVFESPRAYHLANTFQHFCFLCICLSWHCCAKNVTSKDSFDIARPSSCTPELREFKPLDRAFPIQNSEARFPT